jgi:hypothetical protein
MYAKLSRLRLSLRNFQLAARAVRATAVIAITAAAYQKDYD